jgi:hypothetical protein
MKRRRFMMPAVPALDAAKAEPLAGRVTAPVPTWPIPAGVVPAVLSAIERELGFLNHVEAVRSSAQIARHAGWRRLRNAGSQAGRDYDEQKSKFLHGSWPFDFEKLKNETLRPDFE